MGFKIFEFKMGDFEEPLKTFQMILFINSIQFELVQMNPDCKKIAYRAVQNNFVEFLSTLVL